MVGADRDRPAATLDWDTRLVQVLAERRLADIEAELHYSSWAALGRAIADSAAPTSDWSRYASDVLTHLRRKQLLSYEGAPVIDDLEGGLTLGNAVEVFNRCVRAAHLLLVEIRDNPRLRGLADPGGRGLQMGRDSYSTVLTQPVEGFTTTTLICAMRRRTWPDGAGVFVGFDLVHEAGPAAGCRCVLRPENRRGRHRVGVRELRARRPASACARRRRPQCAGTRLRARSRRRRVPVRAAALGAR